MKYFTYVSVFSAIALFSSSPVFGHKNHPHHHGEKAEGSAASPSDTEGSLKAQLGEVNELYKRDVKQIFQKSCFDCHSQTPRLPWYHGVPFVRGLLDGDMAEAKEHLDFSKDYPFQGHGSPMEDLEAIADSIRDKSMPPFRYRIMHPSFSLSDQDRAAILKWVEDSQAILAGKH